jgi:cytochrome b subunit of formate dehydrogenase
MGTEQREEKKSKEEISQTTDEFGVHRQLVFWLFAATAVVVSITAAVLIGVDRGTEETRQLSILPLVAVAGALGAFVSALRRLYSFERIFPRQWRRGLLTRINVYVVAYSSIPPLVGIIAAVVLYVIFASHLLMGSGFPLFECELGENKCVQFVDFVKHWKPSTAPDYAKAVVWGFLAGFSERFVPDILNRIADENAGA